MVNFRPVTWWILHPPHFANEHTRSEKNSCYHSGPTLKRISAGILAKKIISFWWSEKILRRTVYFWLSWLWTSSRFYLNVTKANNDFTLEHLGFTTGRWCQYVFTSRSLVFWFSGKWREFHILRTCFSKFVFRFCFVLFCFVFFFFMRNCKLICIIVTILRKLSNPLLFVITWMVFSGLRETQ